VIPLPLYLAQAQPNLHAGYDDFTLAMSEYVGYGPDPAEWTNQNIAELDRRVQESYRYLLYPSRIPGGGLAHVWSFLHKHAALSLAASGAISPIGTVAAIVVDPAHAYTLPTDFGSLQGEHLFYEKESGYAKVRRTNPQQIRELLQFSATTGQPYYFAVEWAPQVAGNVQRQRLLVYPPVDKTYVVHFDYAVLTGPLSKTNPFPLGGPRMSQVMMDLCRAVGESVKNGARGDKWAEAVGALSDAIAMDAATLTEGTVGPMRNLDEPDEMYEVGIRSLSGSTYVGIA
jgi:hypothetical protein